MNFNLEKIVTVALKLWLLVWPWQTMFIVRQITVKDSLWAGGGIIIPVFAGYLLGLLLTVGWLHKKEVFFNFKKNIYYFSGVIIYSIFSIWHARDHLLALQLVSFWGLGLGLIWLKTKNIISYQDWVWWLSLGAIAPIVLGLYQFFAQSSFNSTLLGLSAIPRDLPGAPVVVGEWGRWLRASGPFPHPNIFAGYLVILAAVIINYFRNESNLNKLQLWFYYVLIMFISGALVTTASRAGLLAWIILVGVECVYIFYFKVKNSRVLLGLTLVTVLIGLSLTSSLLAGRLGLNAQPSAQETVAIVERLTGVRTATTIWQNHTLLGVGPGNYPVALKALKPELKGFELQTVHNFFLLFVLEWGIIGLSLGLFGSYYLWNICSNKAKLILSLLPLLPILLFDHYFYDIWSGVILLAIHISSTVYPHCGLNKPKN